MTSGLLLIDKPMGITSFDVIHRLRKTLGIKKIGHAGTLDKFASGLLVIALGEATKVLGELILTDKEYIAEVHFGVTSMTDDPEGEKTALPNAPGFSKADLQKVLPEFSGKIRQTPPLYSALKVQGKRLSDRARKNEDVSQALEQKTREVEIFRLEIQEFQYPLATLSVHCSSGTYIRSLARDLGKRLHSGAYLENLQRTSVGSFRIEEAKELERVSVPDILPLRPEFFDLPDVQVTEAEAQDLSFGKVITISQARIRIRASKERVSIFCGERMVGFGEIQGDVLQPRKILNV